MVFEVYNDKTGGWRWRLIAQNGRIVADSGESYHNKNDLHQTLFSITESIKACDYKVTEVTNK